MARNNSDVLARTVSHPGASRHGRDVVVFVEVDHVSHVDVEAVVLPAVGEHHDAPAEVVLVVLRQGRNAIEDKPAAFYAQGGDVVQ